ncbi:MAG TPA: hypothetical protein VM223_17890 [Planctomycetota bacterium]|nr:hypothetical protein [Planctomycetota bacterium]
MKYLYPVIAGSALGVGGLVAMLNGFGGYIYYLWWLLLPVIVVLSLARVGQRPLGRLGTFGVMAGLAASLTAAGVGVQILKKHSTCRAVDAVIAELEKHRAAHGTYPADLAGIEIPADIVIKTSRITPTGILIEGINDCDAMLYLSPESCLCLIPLTKTIPMSFTRFYAYEWYTEDPHWRLQKIIKWFGSVKAEDRVPYEGTAER